jgi:hypothetical protein
LRGGSQKNALKGGKRLDKFMRRKCKEGSGAWFQVKYQSVEAIHMVAIRSTGGVLQKGSTLNAGAPVHCQLKLVHWKSQFLFYSLSVLLFPCAAYSSTVRLEAASSCRMLEPHHYEKLRCHTLIPVLQAPCSFIMLTSLAVGLFHFRKLKAVECAEENQNTATRRKFDVSEELSNL